jgi:23S rRNA (uridine2552-2'-O)-methyltransferase|tara:strand:- start:535 stop:1155 length:621 start_codon:yes stop_codon:yes gene_type:complete
LAKKSKKQHWRSNQSQETYFIESKKQKFRSRSTFKLIEIDNKFKIFQPYSLILDLGASPGGWSEYSISKLNDNGKVIATDLVSMERINKVEFILGDFLNDDTQNTILKENSMKKFDVIISDISPAKTGNKVTDQYHFYNIANEILEFSKRGLKSNGKIVIKLFMGLGFEAFNEKSKEMFKKTTYFKPKSSRSESVETYLIASTIRL